MSELGRVGFLGGGQMATALASGALTSGTLSIEHLMFAEPLESQRVKLAEMFPGAEIVSEGQEIFSKCQHVVLSVKPQVLTAIAAQLARCIQPQHVLVSIAAGISLPQLEKMLGTQRIVRVMPNTPCQVGAGAAAMSLGATVEEADSAWVSKLFGSVGIIVRVPDVQMHAVTGLSGSGPAYIYQVIESLSDGGVAQGLPRDLALKLAAQTVLGAAKMVLESGKHPGELKDQVTSPGGTTIAGIRALERAAVRSAFIEAVAQATERSRQLGQ